MADPPPPPPPTNHTAVDAVDDSSSSALATAEYLTRYEVIKRRSQRAKRLSKLYRSHYWALMEEVSAKYKEYYWTYGKSPYKEDDNNREREEIEDGNSTKRREGTGEDGFVKRCGVAGCKAKAMALTRFCHPHILSDSKQKLYKGCSCVVKCAQTGPILCGKPTLRSTVPSLCRTHFQKAEKYLQRALKKEGLNVASLSKVAPKLHVVVAEFVHHIQSNRRGAQEAGMSKIEIKEEKTS